MAELISLALADGALNRAASTMPSTARKKFRVRLTCIGGAASRMIPAVPKRRRVRRLARRPRAANQQACVLWIAPRKFQPLCFPCASQFLLHRPELADRQRRVAL